MVRLRVRLFGTFRVERSEQAVKLTPLAQALLAYLLLYRARSHTREALMAAFWGEVDARRARNRLNTALWRLRKALEPECEPEGSFISTAGCDEVGVRVGHGLLLDVEEFENGLRPLSQRPFHGWSPSEASRVAGALQQYRGDLLDGVYEDWALFERERLRCLYLDGLTELMRYRGYYGEYDAAVACARRVLEVDPVREEIHRFLMRLYHENGERSLAAKQYRRCEDLLREKLGVAPMEETRMVYSQLLENPLATASPPSAADPDPRFHEALGLLKRAIDGFEQASHQLERAVVAVERYTHRK